METANPISPRSRPAARLRDGWVVSPAFDLLFLANLPWLLLLLPWFSADPGSPISFWQVYFLTTPHRWITLLLVATDPDRRDGRGALFVGLAVGISVVVAGAYLASGTFLCLAAVDLVWNGWHFAAQHAGVLRLYGRKGGGGSAWLERWGMRAFVFYVALRLGGWTTGFLRADPTGLAILQGADLMAFSLPGALVAVQLRGWTPRQMGKLAYLLSVCALYTGLLVAVRSENQPLTLALALGSAMFHATEYLAVVTHYAWGRRAGGSAGQFRTMAENWALVLAMWVVALGAFEAFWGTTLGDLWLGLNLVAAFLHYAYDGLIWKLRRPATAAALGVGKTP